MNPMDTKEQIESDYGFLYIHIPKTAGRSIVKALGCVPTMNHCTICECEKKLGRKELLSRTKISCVRNPWDRAVSFYKFFHVGLGINFVDVPYTPNKKRVPMDFDEWLKKMASREQTSRKIDQFSWLRDSSGDVLIDKLIQFEDLETGYGDMRETLLADGLAMPVKMPTVGVVEAATDAECMVYQKYYQTQESIDFVEKLNADLIKQFGYKF